MALPPLLRKALSGFDVFLTDHRLMFLAAFSAYFLFGALLLAVGPDTQIKAALSYYPISAREALRVDAVNGLGFGIALMTATVASSRLLSAQAARGAARTATIPAHILILLFMALGFAASLYTLSFDLGFSQGIVPGVVRQVGKLAVVAVFLAVTHRGKGEVPLRFFGSATVLILAMVGTLEFNKTDALLPVAALVAGLANRFGARRVLPIGLVLLIVGFLLLGNLVPYQVGRQSATRGRQT